MVGILFLIGVAFCSSALAAVVGLGGGMLLLAVMPLVLPPLAVVPVHGVVQLSSNASRSLFARNEVDWSLLPPFLAGVVIGGLFGSRVVLSLPPEYLPLPIGCFILLMTWLPQPGSRLRLPGKFVSLGLMQGFLTLFVGASGPLNMPILLRHGLSGGQVVATHAILMTVVHLVKIVVFGLLGFAFGDYLPLMIGLVAAVTAGSWFGTRLRKRAPDELLKKILKVLVSLLAIRMIWLAL